MLSKGPIDLSKVKDSI